MIRQLALVLVLSACGTVTADPHDAAGGAGGAVAGAGGQLAVGAGGAAGAGGAPSSYPTCGPIGSVAVNGTSGVRCLVDCFGKGTGEIDAGADRLCLVSADQAAQFTNAPAPIYCWQQQHPSDSPPAACY